MLARVGTQQEPYDHPTLSGDIAQETALPLPFVLTLSEELAEEGLVAISPLNDPPLLYLTRSGVSRARRIAS
ncbi:hypothetical protein [Rufibacter latericius]|uniref:Uncharacterized protein n=1 Tax=Rufibacter latericius TaxID=2487040 RepID=A0A3M9MNP1_9BACT|nr:hypothetical protein [Rufibacter latericius]RNI26473.1 hypothetical protein EFB08_11690 [Rufibacter latericius]